MFKRVRDDFQLRIVLIYGLCAAILISAFALYRFLTGSIAGGMLDLSLVLAITAMVFYGWRTNRTELTGKFLHLAESATELPCVGDWVCVRYRDAGAHASIHRLLPRRSAR